ncbi:MAG: rhomboid family intramembrane serine protease [Bacteroidota bacterium]
MNELNKSPDRPAVPPQQMVRVAMPSRAPYVTYTLIGITVVFYVLQMASVATMGQDILIVYGARYNDAIHAGQLWRFLTPALLHASIPHILFNMYALFSFGTGLERHFGHGRFLLLYVLGAYTGNVVSFLLSSGYSVGASTAIFGLLGAEAVFLFQNRQLFAGQFGKAIQNVIFIAVVNLIIGLQPGIDNWGHVGGLLGGLMFTWFAGPIWKIEGAPPELHLVDQRTTRDVIVGAATVILVFSALAMWGMTR